MVIGFKEQFVEPILNGSKIHTIREDATNRWKAGRVMDMATGVRTKAYNKFTEQICIGIQTIEIKWTVPSNNDTIKNRSVKVFIDGKNISHHWYKDTDELIMDVLAKNDGFETLQDFFGWFSEDFTGKLIHWTDLKY
jgi:uncharacterized protein YqfB (UPF0267 family)